MDIIDFHGWLSGKETKDLIKEYLPEYSSGFNQAPQEYPIQDQNPAIQKTWDDILKNNTNETPVKSLLCDMRKLSESVVKLLMDAGKVRFKKYAEKVSVAVPFTTLQGKVLAIQCISSDGSDYPFTIKNGKPANKVFIKDSTPGEQCFFQCGKSVDDTGMLIVTESSINAMTAYECFPEACCIALGSSGSTSKVKALKPYMDSIEKAIVCVDNDDPSEKMLRAIWDIFGAKVFSFKWERNDPPGYDINDVLQAGQKERIIDLIKNSRPIWYKQENISTTAHNDEWTFAKEYFHKSQFPWEVLPDRLCDSFKQLARSCAASPTHLPGIAFGVLAAVLGRHIEVMVKSSWSEPLIFWTLALLPSGEGKTPAQNALITPIYKEQSRLDKIHKEAMEQWVALPTKEQKQTPKPESLGGIFTTDMTIEGLRNDQRMCGGVLISNDEASSFFDGQNQYKSGKGTDRQSWLKLYDGNPARIVRTSGAVFLKGARVSIAGGTQPEVFWRLFKTDDQGTVFLVDGTLFRFMMTWEGEKFFPMVLESWDEFNRDTWSNLIKNAFEFCREQTMISAEGDEVKTHQLWFSNDALHFLIDWANDIKGIKSQLPEQVRGFISKLIGWAARLTGIIKCFESFLEGTRVTQILEPEDLQKGIRLAEFYMAHNIDVIQAIVCSVYPAKEHYTDQEIHLARTLQKQKINVDNGRLAIGFIWEKFNENCPPELHFKTSRAMGGLIRSCNLNVSGGKHDANGKRAVNCLEWNKNTDTFIETCLQSLQSLQSYDGVSFQGADIKSATSAKSANSGDEKENMQTLQTLKSQSLHSNNTSNKGYADIADITDEFGGLLENNAPDEVII